MSLLIAAEVPLVVYQTIYYVFGLLLFLMAFCCYSCFGHKPGCSCLLKHVCLLLRHGLMVRVALVRTCVRGLCARVFSPIRLDLMNRIVSPVWLNQLSPITRCNRFCDSRISG